MGVKPQVTGLLTGASARLAVPHLHEWPIAHQETAIRGRHGPQIETPRRPERVK
jgi:hypothetical protein